MTARLQVAKDKGQSAVDQRTARLLQDFLGSAHIFASAMQQVLETKLLREVAGSRLSSTQLKLLKLIAAKGRQTVGGVAAFLGVSQPAASQAVDRLVRGKWLRRAAGEADRRSIRLSLTPAGRRLLADYDSARMRKLLKVIDGLSPARLRATAALLDCVAARIVNHTANPEEVCLQCGIYFRERCLLRESTGRQCFYQRHWKRMQKPPPVVT